jgi:uncharacterized protein (DUF952 family)
MIIFHIATQTDIDKMTMQGFYTADSLQIEGFIHCSTAAQVPETGKRYFAGRQDLHLLHLDETKLHATLKYELATNQELFPHIYGTIDKEAILKIEKIAF